MNKAAAFLISLLLGMSLFYPFTRYEVKVFAGRTGAAESPQAGFLYVNGVSLNDSKTTLHTKLGVPKKVYTKNENFDELEIHQFANLNVAMRSGQVESVSVPKEVGIISINHVTMPMARKDIERNLGEPTWEAEDGIVYQRGESILKIFLDQATGEVVSVEMYHWAEV